MSLELPPIADLREVKGKDVQALFEPARFQDLVALQRAVGADCDRAQPVIGIVEKETAQAGPDAVVKAGRKPDHEPDFQLPGFLFVGTVGGSALRSIHKQQHERGGAEVRCPLATN